MNQIVLHQGLLYTAGISGQIDIYDIADIQQPRHLNAIQIPVEDRNYDWTRVIEMAVDGQYLYVGTYLYRILVYDISDPLAPVLVRQIRTTDFHSFQVKGDWFRLTSSFYTREGEFCYLGSSYLTVFDLDYKLGDGLFKVGPLLIELDDPAAPDAFDKILSRDVLALHDSYAILSEESGARLYDYSDPSHPVAIYLFNTIHKSYHILDDAILARTDSGYTLFEFVDGGVPERRYDISTNETDEFHAENGILAMSDGNGGIRLYDLNGDSQGVRFRKTGDAIDFLVSDNLAVLSHGEDGLSLLNVSVPGSPTLLSRVNPSGLQEHMALGPNTLFVSTGQGLDAFDVTDPTQPVLVAELELSSHLAPEDKIDSVVAGDQLLFLHAPDRILVVDVGDPHAPQYSTTLADPTWVPARGMTWRAPVLEFSLQRKPRHLGEVMEPTGLAAFDLSDPTAPKRVPSTTTVGYSRTFTADDSVFYGAYTKNGETILDTVDLTTESPVISSRLRLDAPSPIGLATDVMARVGDTLLLHVNGSLQVLDLSDPLHPHVGHRFMGPRYLGDMVVQGNRLFTTDRYSGQMREYQIQNRPLQQVAPWVVNNEGFGAKVAIYNDANHTADILLRAVARDGETVARELTLPPGGVYAAEARALLGSLSGYSLYIYADTNRVHGSFLVSNLEEISGGNSPSQTTAQSIAELSEALVFGDVPGDQTAAVVMCAPGSESLRPVTLSLHGKTEGLIAQTEIDLSADQPRAMLVTDLFPQIDIPADASLTARGPEGMRLAGVTFIFNEHRQPSMAAAMPVRPAVHKLVDQSGTMNYSDAAKPVDEFVFAAAGAAGLHIMDVSGEQITKTGQWQIQGEALNHVARLGEDRLVVQTNRHLVLLDIQDPTHPLELSRFPVEQVHDLAVYDGRVYLSLTAELWVVDLRSDQITRVDRIALDVWRIREGRLAVSDGRLFLLEDQLLSFDLAEPNAPELLFNQPYEGLDKALSAFGDLVAIGGDAGYRLIDVSGRTRPRTLYRDSRPTTWAALEETLLWVGDADSALPIEIADPAMATPGDPLLLGGVHGVSVSGTLYLVGSGGLSRGSRTTAAKLADALLPGVAGRGLELESDKMPCDRDFFPDYSTYHYGEQYWCRGDMVLSQSADLKILRDTSPGNQACVMGSVYVGGKISEGLLIGERFYMTVNDRLKTVDITEPTQPLVVADTPVVEPIVSLSRSLGVIKATNEAGTVYHYADGGAEHLIPWVVNNAAFSSRIALFNPSGNSARVRLEAVDRNGRVETQFVSLLARWVGSIQASEIFPNMSGYSLRLTSDIGRLYVSFMTISLDPVSGGNSPSQTTAAPVDQLTDSVLFGYVPGREIAAVVLVAAEAEANPARQIPVRLTLHHVGGLLEETRVVLTGNQPLAKLAKDLFTELPDDAAIRAVAEDGTAIGGTTFVFNQRRQPSMAKAITLD